MRRFAANLTMMFTEEALFNMPAGDWENGERDLAALPERRDEFKQSARKALEYAEIIGTPLLRMTAGHADPHDAAATTGFRDAIRFAADMAGEKGVGIVIEPINGRDMPRYFLNDFDRAVQLIEELPHPNVRLQFDIRHRGDVLTGLATLMPLIGHVQTASVPNRHEPGTGELDDFRIFEALDALGYQGYVGCEYRPARMTTAGLA